jgi:rhomboid family GlyGly-CTERM serine protease
MSLHQAAPALRLPLITTVVALLAVVIAAEPPVAASLQFDRAAVARGEVWRIVTCHLTHWTPDHLTWDVLTFALLGVIAEMANRRRFATCLIASAVVTPLAVAWARPELSTYRGLSGIDSALFVLVLANLFRSGAAGRVMATVAGLALAAKMGFEWVTGQTLFVDTAVAAFTPVPTAHVAGAVVGLIAGVKGFSRRSVNVWTASMASPLTGQRGGRASVGGRST